MLIDAIQSPIVSTSANISGEPFPIKFEDIDKRIIDSVDIIFNFDTKSSGNPSKIIRIDEFEHFNTSGNHYDKLIKHEPILKSVGKVIDSWNKPVYLIGGYVRDYILIVQLKTLI